MVANPRHLRNLPRPEKVDRNRKFDDIVVRVAGSGSGGRRRNVILRLRVARVIARRSVKVVPPAILLNRVGKENMERLKELPLIKKVKTSTKIRAMIKTNIERGLKIKARIIPSTQLEIKAKTKGNAQTKTEATIETDVRSWRPTQSGARVATRPRRRNVETRLQRNQHSIPGSIRLSSEALVGCEL